MTVTRKTLREYHEAFVRPRTQDDQAFEDGLRARIKAAAASAIEGMSVTPKPCATICSSVVRLVAP